MMFVRLWILGFVVTLPGWQAGPDVTREEERRRGQGRCDGRVLFFS